MENMNEKTAVIATLPYQYRPANPVTFFWGEGRTPERIFVMPNGEVRILVHDPVFVFKDGAWILEGENESE